MPGRAGHVEKAEIDAVVEEELGDGTVRARADLAFQDLDVVQESRALRMLLGIGPDRDLEIADLLGVGDEFGGRPVAVRVRLVGRVEARRRIAAQGHDMAHAGAVIGGKRLADFVPRRADAGQMRRRLHRRFANEPRDRRVGALAGRAACAVGDRDESRVERLEPPRRLPEARLHLARLRRKELEGDADGRARPAQRNVLHGHQANSASAFGNRSEMIRGSSREPYRDRQLARFAGHGRRRASPEGPRGQPRRG